MELSQLKFHYIRSIFISFFIMDEEAQDFLRRWLNDGEPPEPNEQQRIWIVEAHAQRHAVHVLRVVDDVMETAEVNHSIKMF